MYSRMIHKLPKPMTASPTDLFWEKVVVMDLKCGVNEKKVMVIKMQQSHDCDW